VNTISHFQQLVKVKTVKESMIVFQWFSLIITLISFSHCISHTHLYSSASD